MSLIDMTGKPLNGAHKRGHDSERVMGVRNMLLNVMNKLQQQWIQDMATDPSGATRPNDAAIDQHYIQKWVEQCTTIMNSADPVEVDPEAMAKWILEQRRKMAMEQPLHQVLDLEPYGFRLVGTYAKGHLWVSTECALWLEEGGLTHVVLRKQSQTLVVFMSSLEQKQFFSNASDVTATDYTLKELMGMLRSMRRERPAFPLEEDVVWLRNELNAALPRP